MSHCFNSNIVATNSICDVNTMDGVIIFILIILQFGKSNGFIKERYPFKEGGNNQSDIQFDQVTVRFPCEPISTKFVNKIERLNTNDSYSFSKMINTSLTQTVIFFVKNLDKNEITAHLQVSPDGINFINEPAIILVGMNKIKLIVPCIFAKFTRLAARNIHHGETSKIKIWYQAQN